MSKKVEVFNGVLLYPDLDGMREILKQLGIKNMKQYKEYIKNLPIIDAKESRQVPLAFLEQALTKKQTEILCKIIDKYPPKNGKKRTVDEWIKIAEEMASKNGKFKLQNVKKLLKKEI